MLLLLQEGRKKSSRGRQKTEKHLEEEKKEKRLARRRGENQGRQETINKRKTPWMEKGKGPQKTACLSPWPLCTCLEVLKGPWRNSEEEEEEGCSLDGVFIEGKLLPRQTSPFFLLACTRICSRPNTLIGLSRQPLLKGSSSSCCLDDIVFFQL